MLGYEMAKTVHFFSILGIFISTGYSFALMNDESKAKKIADNLQAIFGVLIFASAFWLVSVLELHSNFPLWGKMKTAIWLLLTILGILSTKKKYASRGLFVVIFILGFLAIAIAVFKPELV